MVLTACSNKDDTSIDLPTSDTDYFQDVHHGWAGCNIYYDGKHLTFDDVGNQSHEHDQGVFFQRGSLYGISPVGNFDVSTSAIFRSIY